MLKNPLQYQHCEHSKDFPELKLLFNVDSFSLFIGKTLRPLSSDCFTTGEEETSSLTWFPAHVSVLCLSSFINNHQSLFPCNDSSINIPISQSLLADFSIYHLSWSWHRSIQQRDDRNITLFPALWLEESVISVLFSVDFVSSQVAFSLLYRRVDGEAPRWMKLTC